MLTSKNLFVRAAFIAIVSTLLCSSRATIGQTVSASSTTAAVTQPPAYCDIDAHKTQRCCTLAPSERAKDSLCRLNDDITAAPPAMPAPDIHLSVVAPAKQPTILPATGPGVLGGIMILKQ
jgi:hypothetical protein